MRHYLLVEPIKSRCTYMYVLRPVIKLFICCKYQYTINIILLDLHFFVHNKLVLKITQCVVNRGSYIAEAICLSKRMPRNVWIL